MGPSAEGWPRARVLYRPPREPRHAARHARVTTPDPPERPDDDRPPDPARLPADAVAGPSGMWQVRQDVPPARSDVDIEGPLPRDVALRLLARGDQLMEAGEPGEALRYYHRVMGFDDAAVTAASLLGVGNALQRLDRRRRGAVLLAAGHEAAGDAVDVPGVAQHRGGGRCGAGRSCRPRGLPGGGPPGAARGQGRTSQAASAGCPSRPATSVRPAATSRGRAAISGCRSRS